MEGHPCLDSPYLELFEFPAQVYPDICVADHVFLHGHLLPSSTPSLSPSSSSSSSSSCSSSQWKKRSSSSDITSPSDPSQLKGNARRPPATRPKWYEILCGPTKLKSKVDMSSIKLRQRHLYAAPRTEGVRARGMCWELLLSLGCRAHVGVDALSPNPIVLV